MNVLERQVALFAALAGVIDEIKTAPLKGAFDVKGEVIYLDRILRTKVLKIFDKSTLILDAARTEPFVVIAAKELIIDNPTVRAVITRPSKPADLQNLATSLKGTTGGTAAGGGDGLYTDQHGHGAPGGDGGEGGLGGPGGTFNLPPVFVFAQEIRLGTGTRPDHECVELFFDGYPGGEGGRGGTGGPGGRGHEGAQGVEDFWGCIRGGGRGGDAGRGGMAGQGGKAGFGGAGADVFFLAPTAKIDMLKFFSVRQEGGKQGPGGQIGEYGTQGTPGGAGRGTARCGGGTPGTTHSNRRPDSGTGDATADGPRGKQDFVTRDNTDLF